MVEDLTVAYGGTPVVRGVSLRVGPGETVALLGRNGAGKTTTLMAIAGARPARAGRILVDGLPTQGLASYRVAARGVSIVPQGRRIFPTLTVRENLLLGDRKGDLARVHVLFPILRDRARLRGAALSGGEQQMLAIGRALMTTPRLLLMDEPSEGLAPQVVRSLGETIAGLQQDGRLSILLSEQNLPLALAVASRVYVLERGEVVFEGTAESLRRDRVLQQRYLGV